MNRWLAAIPLMAALALGGCDRDPPEPEPTAPPATARSPEASIIRPEVAPEPAPEQPPAPLEATVPFPEGGFDLDERAEAVLAQVLESPQLAQGWPVVLRGHTDSVGGDAANLQVSRRRAQAVAEWLGERGVDEQRLEVIALGEQRPVAPNANLDGTPDEEGRAKNRRVTVTIAPPAREPAEAPPDEQAPADEQPGTAADG